MVLILSRRGGGLPTHEVVTILRSGPTGINAWNTLREEENSLLEADPRSYPGSREWAVDSQLVRGTSLAGAVKEEGLVGADLSNANLSGIDFSHAYLNKLILRNAILTPSLIPASTADGFVQIERPAAFVGASLEYADLGHAKCMGAVFRNSRLIGADFSYADLTNADLSGADCTGVDFSNANLCGAKLQGAMLANSAFRNAKASRCDLRRARIIDADLSSAGFQYANLSEADLTRCDFTDADMRHADLCRARILNSKLIRANISESSVFGISVWDVDATNSVQSNLNISEAGAPSIAVDNLEIAQFIYLLLSNDKVRGVIDTLTSKVVLILGRFITERKEVLETLRNELRKHRYVPILFDFEKPASRDITETISTLAHLARFIIADITDAKSVPQELMAIVPSLPSVPVVPLLETAHEEYSTFEHLTRFPWVLPVMRYYGGHRPMDELASAIIAAAEAQVVAERAT